MKLPGNPIDREVKVGDYALISEKGQKNKLLFYVIKVKEISNEMCLCSWFTYKDKKRLFVKMNANWEADVHSMLTFIEPPETVGSKRRGKLLFREVYEFLTRSKYSLQENNDH